MIEQPTTMSGEAGRLLPSARGYASLVDDCQIIMDKIDSLRASVDTSTERGLAIEETLCRARNCMMEARNDCAS